MSRYHGTLDLAGQPAVELTIEADSVDTENTKRDTHLRSRDFFGDDLDVEAATAVDHRQLGMTWNQMRSIGTVSKLRVTGRLVRDAD